MKALVIGGTGPSGPFVVNGLIKRGYDVTVLHGGQHEAEFVTPIEHIHTDPHFKETLEPSLAGRSYDLTIATYGRVRIVADVMKGKTKRLITVGGGVYAGRSDPRWGSMGAPMVIPEDGPKNDDPATSSKMGHAIYQAESAVFQGQKEGHYQSTIFRYGMIYGPNAPANPDWSVVRRILDRRKEIVVAASGGLRNRAYAENAAQALLLAADKPKETAGQAFNVRDRMQFTHKQEIEFMARVLEKDIKVVEMPPELVKNVYRGIGAQLGEGARDITKMVDLLGYEDVVPIDEALRRTVEWLVRNPPEPGGEVERQTGDPFAYEIEDQLIQAYKKTMAELEAIEFPESTGGGHMYRHPKKPGEAWAPPSSRQGPP